MNDVFGSPRGWIGRSLSLLGILLIGGSVIAQNVRRELDIWFVVATLVACAAWLWLVVIGRRGRAIATPLLVVMMITGGIAGTATNGVSVVIAAVAVIRTTRDLRRAVWWGAGFAVLTIAVVLVGNVLAPASALAVLSMDAGVIVGFLAGESRRQFQLADIRWHELIEEQAQTDVLAARQQLAHDIHDVLAHSLGGLVIQLDAVDALLDSGDTAAASAKVREARVLAAEGLGEARRAVAALSAPPAADDATRVPGEDVVAGVEALISAHRSLGGSARLIETGSRREVTKPVSIALGRAVQEGLTNARKHAPGKAVTLTIAWRSREVTVEIVNPLGSPERAIGGGHGLVGMRDRFAALPGGAVTSGVNGGRFVVTASVAA